MIMATIITKKNFDDVVLKSDKPVLIDFWAGWCGPCRMLAPTIDKLYDNYSDKAVIGKVDVDEENELAARFGVRSIPTVVLMKNGKIVEQVVGVRPYETFVQMLDKHI
jgi:thioredoxin 1